MCFRVIGPDQVKKKNNTWLIGKINRELRWLQTNSASIRELVLFIILCEKGLFFKLLVL